MGWNIEHLFARKSARTEYVCGLLFADCRDRVVLIRKQHPAWQRGLLNGVGGHIESGENAHDAMRREFYEETGVDIEQWELATTLIGTNFVVYFFRAFALDNVVDNVQTMTQEAIEIHTLAAFPELQTLRNLKWIVPFCADPCVVLPLVVEDRQ